MHTHVGKQKRNKTKHASRNTEYGGIIHSQNIKIVLHLILFIQLVVCTFHCLFELLLFYLFVWMHSLIYCYLLILDNYYYYDCYYY